MVKLSDLLVRKAPQAIEEGIALIKQQQVAYSIHRKPRRLRVALYIEPSGKLRFVAPLRTRLSTIQRFMERSEGWIVSKLSDAHKRTVPHFPAHLEEGTTLYYLGQPYTMNVKRETKSEQSCILLDNRLEINLPQQTLSPTEKDEEIRLEIILWYKKQARQFLKNRIDFWAQAMQVKFRSFKITSPTRQWGSCSARNDIRLNWRVMMAPLSVIDYLIVHELAHIKHKNHSLHFWHHIAQFLPDYKIRQKVLKHMDAGFPV